MASRWGSGSAGRFWSGRLRRMRQRLDYIEGLRGVAVGIVMLFHAGIWAGLHGTASKLLAPGELGVDLFFVISGFCMTWPLLAGGEIGRLSPGPFLQRRAWRIGPPYLAAVAVCVAVSALMWQAGGATWWSQPMQSTFGEQAPNLAGNLATHVTFLHGLFPAFDREIDGAFWSLSTEWQFYALLPLLIPVARRIGMTATVAGAVLVSLVYATVLHVGDPGFLASSVGRDLIVGRLVEFAGGMLAAGWIAQGRRLPYASSMAALLGLVVIVNHYKGVYPARPFLCAAAFTALVFATAQGGPLGTLSRQPQLRWLGNISYSLYLVHGTAYMLLAVLVTNLDMEPAPRKILMYVLSVPLAIVAAVVLNRLVELPAVGWSHRHRSGRKVPAEVTS